MAGRDRVPATMDGRSLHGPIPVLSRVDGHRQVELLHHPELLEAKIAAQAAEIKQLLSDNQRLSSGHVHLRDDLMVAKQIIQRLKAHMRSLKTESDIQIRVLTTKIAKAEVNVKAAEEVSKEVDVAFKEAKGLVMARKELEATLQETTKELEKARDDIKSLPDLQTELTSLRRERQRLRATFENEKTSNIDEVEQLQAMEQQLLLMAKEVEKLRTDVSNVEKRANAPVPFSGGYMNPNFPYPPPTSGGNTPYISEYGKPHVPVNNQAGMWPPGEQVNARGSSGSAGPATLVFPASGVVGVPSNGGSAASKSGDPAAPSGGEAVVAASVVASASTSGGDGPRHSQG